MRGHFLRDKSGFLLPFTAAAVNGYKPIDGNGTVVVFLETTYRTLQVLVTHGHHFFRRGGEEFFFHVYMGQKWL